MEEIKKTKTKRAAIRTTFTKTEEKFMKSVQEKVTEVEIVALFKVLEEKINELRKLDEEMLDCLVEKDNMHDIEEEVNQRDKYQTEFYKCQEIFETLRKESNELNDNGTLRSKARTIISVHNMKTATRFPKINLPCFSGNPKEWLGFWSVFKSIHESTEFSNEEKFQHLLQSMSPQSRAMEVIKGYPPSSPSGDNYDKAIESLCRRFGRTELLTEVYVRELLKILLQNFKLSLPQLYDNLETQINSLHSLGVDMDACSPMLYPLVESCIPGDLLKVWDRSGRQNDTEVAGSDTEGGRIKKLMNFLRAEVESTERIQLTRTGFGLSTTTKESRVQRSEEVPTASTLVATNIKENPHRDNTYPQSKDSEQSPGVYLRDDPLFGNQPPHCELRVPTAERAAHYLDIAIESRAPTKEEARNSHLLFTLHVYQYSVAGKGGVAGGRSRLHLFDLGNSERGKSSGGIPLSGLGNILLAIFNGQKHLPYKEHKLTHLLKDCLNSLTCHAAMIAHVSSYAQNYLDTLTTVQLASRIHRMRRRRIKFVSAGVGNGSGGSSGEEATRTTGTSSEPDPSSSDLSADTVIYVGPADDATDGEHPPVYIPSLNSGDNRCVMSKALRGSTAEQRLNKISVLQKPSASDEKTSTHRSSIKTSCQSNKTSPAHTNSPKSSPSRIPSTKSKTQLLDGIKHSVNGGSDEHWIDGPRISKSKVAEARHLMKEPCHVKKRETWIDGPMHAENSTAYGYMDSHKKNMIRKWVEHQTSQIQRKQQPSYTKVHDPKSGKEQFKELTQFKTFDEEILKPIDSQKHESIEESIIRTGLKLSNTKVNHDAILECQTPDEKEELNAAFEEEYEDDDEAVEMPPALPLIQPLSSREVSLESLDNLLKERLICNQSTHDDDLDDNICSDDDEILEIIEVEEPLEPVPTQDCCLQVTEEDIAFCMGILENPLPEVDQENPLDHPLRILSQENLTVVSTFTDSMSVYTDLERILPRHRYDPKYGLYNDDYEDPDNPYRKAEISDEASQQKFNQLARLHELYSHSLAKAGVTSSDVYKQLKPNLKPLTRCESLSLSDMLYGVNGLETSSIYSEPAYIPDEEKFCENCKVSMTRPATAQHWYDDAHLSFSNNELSATESAVPPISRRFQRYCHKYSNNGDILAHLRHPDGASNPNLREESERIPGNGASAIVNTKHSYSNIMPQEEVKSSRPLTPPNSLPSTERINRNIMSIEGGFTSIKLNQKQSDDYDSGHDSTPRTSKHSPAAISRRAESGYDSVVRDSESSSIDSDTSRLSHLHNRRGKCKHKHDKSFCSWFLHPFTCKYIHEPPETHF